MNLVARPRSLACARCGAAFECGSTIGKCWCAEQQFRLPMPLDASADCLCPGCLQAAAGAFSGEAGTGSP